MDTKTGELVTRRLISAALKPPAWMAAIGFPDYCYVLEETRVNPITKNMVLKSVNVTGGEFLQIQETCEYSAIGDDNKQCLYEQSAAITSFVPLVQSAIESYALGIHSEKATKGLKAMEGLCEKYVKLGQEGFNEILNLRLDTICLMTDLETYKNLDFDFDDLKNLPVIQWASKFAEDLFSTNIGSAAKAL